MQHQTNFDLLHNIHPGKHLYQFYKHAVDFMQVMVPYFQAGLAEKNTACLWVVSETIGIDHARAVAEALIPEFTPSLASGRFLLCQAEAWYLADGRFDEERALRNAAQHLAEIQEAGYRWLRIAGDTGAVDRSDWEKFRRYERTVSSWIKQKPATALCAYPILSCTPSQTRDVLECHDDVLVGHL